MSLPPDAATRLVAHRGHPARFAENSLAGLDSVVRAGARWLEVDVQCSADGTLWLFHDLELARLAGSPGTIAGASDEELAELRLVPPPGGEPQPLARLSEMAHWLAEAPDDVFVFVEVKPHAVAALGAAPTLRAALADLEPALARCALISFSLPLLALARDACELPLAPILHVWKEYDTDGVRELAPEWIFVNRRLLPRGPLPAEDWGWIVYETVDAGEAAELLARGAALVETFDWPRMARELEGRE